MVAPKPAYHRGVHSIGRTKHNDYETADAFEKIATKRHFMSVVSFVTRYWTGSSTGGDMKAVHSWSALFDEQMLVDTVIVEHGIEVVCVRSRCASV